MVTLLFQEFSFQVIEKPDKIMWVSVTYQGLNLLNKVVQWMITCQMHTYFG